MIPSKRIQLNPAKLVGVKQLHRDIAGGKLTLAQAMVGNGKVCQSKLAAKAAPLD